MSLVETPPSSLLAVVLAGGQSSRMGQDKAAMYSPKLKATLLEHCIDLLLKVNDAQVWVSGGNGTNSIADIYPHRGPLSGIHSVLEYLGPDSEVTELLFVPVDMPNLCPQTLKKLVAFARTQRSSAYINNSYLPCYLALNPMLATAVRWQIEHSQNWSIKSLMHKLKAQSFSGNSDEELININEPQTFTQYCS